MMGWKLLVSANCCIHWSEGWFAPRSCWTELFQMRRMSSIWSTAAVFNSKSWQGYFQRKTAHRLFLGLSKGRKSVSWYWPILYRIIQADHAVSVQTRICTIAARILLTIWWSDGEYGVIIRRMPDVYRLNVELTRFALAGVWRELICINRNLECKRKIGLKLD